MGTFEIGLLAIGISLDAFTVMACKGAMLRKIHLPSLILVSAFFGGCQVLAFSLGNSIRHIDVVRMQYAEVQLFVRVIAAVIFFALAIYFISKVVRKQRIEERRQDNFSLKEEAAGAFLTSVDALLAGVALGLLNISIAEVRLSIFLVNVLSVMLGTYIGYYVGYEHQKKIYLVSNIILLVIGIEVLIQFIL